MAAAGRLALLHGGRRLELDAAAAARRGGLRALEREAEGAFGLRPRSFAMHGPGGRVDSPEALQRALLASAGGVCALELREHPEWRELNAAAADLEGRVMAKVEAALAGLRGGLASAEERLDRGLAPMVQALALEQVDLRASVEALRGLPPLVQSLAMEQLGAREALAAAHKAPEAAPPAQPAAAAAPQLLLLCTPPSCQNEAEKECSEATSTALKDLQDLEKQLRQDFGDRLCAVEQADEYLFSELQSMLDCSKAAQKDVEQLRSDLQGLEQKHGERGEAAQDPPGGPRGLVGGPDAWMPWSESLPAAIPYSGKVLVEFPKGAPHGKRGWAAGKRADVAPPEGPAPFARGTPLRPLERSPGCQSLPLLPPLR